MGSVGPSRPSFLPRGSRSAPPLREGRAGPRRLRGAPEEAGATHGWSRERAGAAAAAGAMLSVLRAGLAPGRPRHIQVPAAAP